MESDLSHEAIKRFSELEGHIGQLYKRVHQLEEATNNVPEDDEIKEETEE